MRKAINFTEEDLKHLVQRLKRDDLNAFDDLYHHFSSKLYVFAVSKIRSKPIAEELVHDVFLSLWNRRHDLTVDTNATGYLFTMLKNNVLMYLRSSTAKAKFIDIALAEVIQADQNSDTRLTFEELYALLQKMIDRLPAKCREVFVLSRDQGLNTRQISQRLDLAPQTVKNQIAKAVKTLRGHYQKISSLLLSIFI